MAAGFGPQHLDAGRRRDTHGVLLRLRRRAFCQISAHPGLLTRKETVALVSNFGTMARPVPTGIVGSLDAT